MKILATDVDDLAARMLEGYDCPAILMNSDYRILACNDLYREAFGEIDDSRPAHCYAVSHGFNVPCNRAGEDCPLEAAMASGAKERVLHIHQTPRGQEHVDVELLPITEPDGAMRYFVELLKPVHVAGTRPDGQPMVGVSRAFNRMLEAITRVAPWDASVLLTGPSGAGKELAAQAIHQAGHRRANPMVTLECAGLTETLFESELFGHVKGAFTGANFEKKGLAEAADGGTLFLDEVGDIPYPLQVKLLRLIETGVFRPVGSHRPKASDFRLICATHQDLWGLVQAGQFRADLYYRINVFPIQIPALAERIEDLPLLAQSLLKKLDPHHEYNLTESAIRALRQHSFPGNIRELRNLLTRSLVLADTNVIDEAVIRKCLINPTGPEADKGELVDLKTLEHQYLQDLLRRFDQDKEKVARTAGISLRSLYRKLQDSQPGL